MNKEEQDSASDEIFAYYKSVKEPGSQDNLVTMLREIQEVYGCIPADLQQRAADTAGVKLSIVISIMKLYKSLKPAAYRHKLLICTGPRCIGKNKDLLDVVRKELGIKADGLSLDGTILLDTQSCLKHCRTAPNLMIDGKLYPGITINEAKELITKLR